MFTVTDPVRLAIRREVLQIKAGQRPGVRALRIPAYLGGDFVPLGKKPHSTETLLNPVDPLPDRVKEDA
jgi:hypothetical protein